MAKKNKKEVIATPEPKDAKSKKKAYKNQNSQPELETGVPKPQRGLAIGDNFGWTGKLPATLLFEYAQKQKWNKVIIEMRKVSKGFVGTVDLSWENPKTREVIHIKMTPDADLLPPRETTNEARHFAATFAMYRINYVKNLKMVLPTIFRSYWSDLETRRLEVLKRNKVEHDKFYNANPFQVYLDNKAQQESRAKERQAKQDNDAKIKITTSISIVDQKSQSGATKKRTPVPKISKPKSLRSFPTIGRKAWENAPFIDFPSDIRTSIESSIKHHINWLEDQEEHKPENVKSWTQQLTDLGFRASHVSESLSHTHSFVDALEWLLFHVPEDDLPPFFAKRDEDSSVSLKISTNIQTEYRLQRLALSGFDMDDIEATLKECNGDEILTSIALTHRVVNFETPVVELQGDEFDMWCMELEGIETIGSNKVEFSDSSKKIVSISLNAQGIPTGMLSVRLIFSDHYPYSFPGIQLVVNNPSFKLANYIKLSILRQLLSYILANNLLGECFVFSLIEWLEENIAKVIEHPGPLVISDPHQKGFKNQISGSERLSKKKKGNNSRLHVLSTTEIEEMRNNYQKQISSPAMRDSNSKRKKLPAWQKREELVNVINSNKVTLVTGETGSGKSTQIVQFILDDLNSKGNFEGTIICTQPRRISTIGLAERISDERVSSVGKDVGFIIRGENKTSKQTRISFVTTGVILRMLQSFLSAESSDTSIFDRLEYIFIDEVHERSVDSDLLLVILKKVMNRFPKLKIVLMSATISIDTFKNFFSPVNHIHIEGRTFPIQDYYLDTILDDLDYTITTNDQIIKPRADSHYFKTGTLNFELIAQLCIMVDQRLTSEKNRGSILIFLPGIMEISRCIRSIESAYDKSGSDCWCLPLHSVLSSKDQTRVFNYPPKGARKIVVSTNIAETSITIPDCVVVIDGGRSKSVFFDSKANTTKLVENWCSRAEMAQRKGRSGRIQKGTCYHLYTKETENNALAQPVPEIKRTRLENLYLVVKAMGINKVEEFLNSGIDPPEAQSLKKARYMLREIGALDYDDKNENLTHLGKYLSFIPTDLQAGKLMLLGCIFGCVNICLTIAAICSSGSPFLTSFDVKDDVRRAKERIGKNQGDVLASAFAFHQWENLPREKRKKFISENYLSYLTLHDIQSTRTQYLSTLKEIGFIPFNYRVDDKSKHNVNNENYTIVRAIITGSFTPQLARVQLPDPKYAQTLAGAVEIDPDARASKIWIRNEKYIEQTNGSGTIDELPATRAFIHPSSMLFSTSDAGVALPNLEDLKLEDGSIDLQKAREQFDLTPSSTFNPHAMHKSPFVVYISSNETTKLYLRDITPTSTLAALLFGGEISYDMSTHVTSGMRSPGIVLDRWMPVRTWCKNGVLLKRLRKLLDQVIENKLSNPNQETAEVADDEILDVVTTVLEVETRKR